MVSTIAVEVRKVDGTLQQAAEIVQSELLKKGEWYKALVDSIAGYLIEYYEGIIDPEEAANMAIGLADRISGREDIT